MSYLDAALLNQTLSYEAVSSRSATGYQDKSYSAAASFDCREETAAERMLDSFGVEVLATSFVFVEASIFSTPDVYARYTLPSGDVVRLVKAEAIKNLSDTSEAGDSIKHWECYFTKS